MSKLTFKLLHLHQDGQQDTATLLLLGHPIPVLCASHMPSPACTDTGRVPAAVHATHEHCHFPLFPVTGSVPAKTVGDPVSPGCLQDWGSAEPRSYPRARGAGGPKAAGARGFAEATVAGPEARARLRLPACCSLPWRVRGWGMPGCVAPCATGHRHRETATAVASSGPREQLVLLPHLLMKMGTGCGASCSSILRCHRRCHGQDAVQSDGD